MYNGLSVIYRENKELKQKLVQLGSPQLVISPLVRSHILGIYRVYNIPYLYV